jgi:hypothetical protein
MTLYEWLYHFDSPRAKRLALLVAKYRKQQLKNSLLEVHAPPHLGSPARRARLKSRLAQVEEFLSHAAESCVVCRNPVLRGKVAHRGCIRKEPSLF